MCPWPLNCAPKLVSDILLWHWPLNFRPGSNAQHTFFLSRAFLLNYYKIYPCKKTDHRQSKAKSWSCVRHIVFSRRVYVLNYFKIHLHVCMNFQDYCLCQLILKSIDTNRVRGWTKQDRRMHANTNINYAEVETNCDCELVKLKLHSSHGYLW